jgi:UDP-glucose 4-epimerase
MLGLFTGGAGFIGSNVYKLWCNLGNEGRIIDNLSSGNIKNIPKNSDFIKGDILDEAILKDAIRGCDFIFNFAASVGNKRSIENPILDCKINVLGFLNILELARRLKIKKIIHSSSAAVFGELKYNPITENHPLNPNTPYGVSKLYDENISKVYLNLFKMKIVCLRYFNVYGPNQRFDAYGNVIPIFVKNIQENKSITIFSDGHQTRDFVNVFDVASANINSALSQNTYGIFNIGSGTSISINHLAKKLYTIFNKEPRIIYRPKRSGDVRHSVANINYAKNSFNYHPKISINDGLKEYVHWFTNNL